MKISADFYVEYAQFIKDGDNTLLLMGGGGGSLSLQGQD
jgi:hypothetical protein